MVFIYLYILRSLNEKNHNRRQLNWHNLMRNYRNIATAPVLFTCILMMKKWG